MLPKYIDQLLGKMNIEEKVGQLFVFSLFGSHKYPDIYDRVVNMNCSGLRVNQGDRMFRRYSRPDTGEIQGVYRIPKGINRDLSYSRAPYVSVSRYAEFLNSVKQMGMNRPHGIPLHLVLDQEGDNSADFLMGGAHFFPSQMGIATTGDEDLCFRVYSAVAEQLRAVGINMIHSPVLDVNTEPLNPEIGARAFSNEANTCSKFALEMLKAFKSHNLIATGKHFPGRGSSKNDAHFDLPIINISRKELEKTHLKPFKEVISAGLEAVMIAHSIYPRLDPSEDIATISKIITTDILRGELGFEGVITTDSISMGALVKQCKGDIPEACIRSLEAGADLILVKDEDWISVDCYDKMLEAVKSGRVTERRIDQSLIRTLKMKENAGLFEDYDLVDVDKVQAIFDNDKFDKLESEMSEKVVKVLRNDNTLPLKPDDKILLIEQEAHLGIMVNDDKCHCGMLWEEMLKYNPEVMCVEIPYIPTESDIQRIKDRIDQADKLVLTNSFNRGNDINLYRNFIISLINESNKDIVLVTNTPYSFGAIPECKTVICTYGSVPSAWKRTANLIFS